MEFSRVSVLFVTSCLCKSPSLFYLCSFVLLSLRKQLSNFPLCALLCGTREKRLLLQLIGVFSATDLVHCRDKSRVTARHYIYVVINTYLAC